jgi:hypothetical protein
VIRVGQRTDEELDIAALLRRVDRQSTLEPVSGLGIR